MKTNDIRRFNLIDAMILCAAVAVGIVAFRSCMIAYSSEDVEIWPEPPVDIPGGIAHHQPLPQNPFAIPQSPDRWHYWIEEIFIAASTSLTILTAAIFLLYLRRPRPPANHLIRRPGAAACFAAMVALAMEVITTLAWWVTNLALQANEFFWPRWMEITQHFMEKAGVVVTATWLVLALSRNWSSRNLNWLDLLGILIGLAWLAMAFESALLTGIAPLPQ